MHLSEIFRTGDQAEPQDSGDTTDPQDSGDAIDPQGKQPSAFHSVPLTFLLLSCSL